MANEKWAAIHDGAKTVSYEWAEEDSITPPDGHTVTYYNVPQLGLMTEVKTGSISTKLTALLALDASAVDDATIKTIVEFLQEKHGI